MKGRPEVERVDLFGDTMSIVYDAERNEMQGVGRLSPTDTSRLLDKIAEHYGAAKTKRGKRIAELAAELARLVKTDCDFYADTYSFIASGKTIKIGTDQQVIQMKTEEY